MIALIFPGQGVPLVGAGAPWVGDPAWEAVHEVERATGVPLEGPLLGDCDDGDKQLMLFALEMVAWRRWEADHGLQHVVGIAGHSLGQLAALVASDAVALGEMACLVAERSRLTSLAAHANPGAMSVVLRWPLAHVEAVVASTAGPGCWIANDNSPEQCVIAGHPAHVAEVERGLVQPGHTVARLPIDGAFHTPFMQDAASSLARAAEHLHTSAPRVPIVLNATAACVTSRSGWPRRLGDHLVKRVEWRRSLERLSRMGAHTFVQLGPGRTLVGLVRRTLPTASTFALSPPAETDTALRVLRTGPVR